MTELNEEERRALIGKAKQMLLRAAGAEQRAKDAHERAIGAFDALRLALPGEEQTVETYAEHLRQSGDTQAAADFGRLLVAAGKAEQAAESARDEANDASGEIQRVVSGLQAQGLLPPDVGDDLMPPSTP